MSYEKRIEETLLNMMNELVVANKLYYEKFSNEISEATYYKVLERLTEKNKLMKISKGIYCVPKKTKYGNVTLSEKEIIKPFIENEKGIIVGYSLYNSINITTQLSKKIEIYSSFIDTQVKNINNIFIKKNNIKYSEEVIKSIQLLEVLEHFKEIEDLNYFEFKKLCESYVSIYDDNNCMYVIENIKYSKSTIAFLREILNHYKIKNKLNKYLSTLSTYKIPNIKEIYEIT